MSFQLVGFLLTYLLHTSHAAKNGSKAGLGITLVQWGFGMRASRSPSGSPAPDPTNPNFGAGQPPDPNNHDFDPDKAADGAGGDAAGSLGAQEFVAYALMIVGWFVLIRAIGEYLKARRHEQLVLSSSEGRNGGAVPVVADGEDSGRVV